MWASHLAIPEPAAQRDSQVKRSTTLTKFSIRKLAGIDYPWVVQLLTYAEKTLGDVSESLKPGLGVLKIYRILSGNCLLNVGDDRRKSFLLLDVYG